MPYLNSVVFYTALQQDDIQLISLPPRNMAHAMSVGKLDAGPLPIAEVLRMKDKLTPIGNLGVATNGQARSVLLFSKVSVQNLTSHTIAVTSHTSTSIQLLRILLDQLWKVPDIKLEKPDADADAKLIIGDSALRAIHSPSLEFTRVYPYIYDLSLEWQRLTGMPFVFARWVARADLDISIIQELTGILDNAYQHGKTRITQIAHSKHIPEMTAQQIEAYIRGFTYQLAQPELEAIQEFKSRLASLPEWLPPVMPYSPQQEK